MIKIVYIEVNIIVLIFKKIIIYEVFDIFNCEDLVM